MVFAVPLFPISLITHNSTNFKRCCMCRALAQLLIVLLFGYFLRKHVILSMWIKTNEAWSCSRLPGLVLLQHRISKCSIICKQSKGLVEHKHNRIDKNTITSKKPIGIICIVFSLCIHSLYFKYRFKIGGGGREIPRTDLIKTLW